MEKKFRFWDPFNGCMVFSDSFISNLDYEYKCLAKFFHQLNSCDEGENNPVLEQFTGLKDKNGVEIFEGDIVYSMNFKKKFTVIIKMGVTSFEDSASKKYYKLGLFLPLGNYGTGNLLLQIIGNKHEKPELLIQG